MSRTKDSRQQAISVEDAIVISDAVKEANQYTDKKVRDLNRVMIGVVIVVLISFVAMVVTLTAIVLDQMRFNNSTYKEKSFLELQKQIDELLLRSEN